LLVGASFTVPTQTPAIESSNSSDALVSVIGTASAPPTIASNAITLSPGESIPVNAVVGQEFISPKVIPLNYSGLIVHANPGQSVTISNYNGPVILLPSYPTVTKIISRNQSLFAANSVGTLTNGATPTYSASTQAKTAVIEVDYKNGNEGTGGILDFNGKWVTDNHVLNDINVNPPSEPNFIQIAHNATGDVAELYDIEDAFRSNLGLASPLNVKDPSGSSYNMTVVSDPTVGQSAFAYSQLNASSFGNYVQNATLTRVRVEPGADVYPDPMTSIYNRFSPIGQVTYGWSGIGVWDSDNHLLAMTECGSSPKNMFWGFDGGDIRDFRNAHSIPYTISTGS